MLVQDLPNPFAIVIGVMTGIVALITPVSPEETAWLTFKIVLIIVAFGFTATNLVWLIVLSRRKSHNARKA